MASTNWRRIRSKVTFIGTRSLSLKGYFGWGQYVSFMICEICCLKFSWGRNAIIFYLSMYTQPSNSFTSIIVDTYDIILDDIQNKKRDRETFQEITSSLE